MLGRSSAGPGVSFRPVSKTNRHVLRKCRTVVRSSQVTVLGCPPWYWLRKKDGSTRFCVDYRRMNSLTVKDAYPLPRIDDSLRFLGNQQWFSTMDLASRHWQVAMSADTKLKAAFVTHEGLTSISIPVMPRQHLRDLWTVYCVECVGLGVWCTGTM